MNYIELQRMRKAAGLGWGWVNDLVGDDNFVSDIFGNDRYEYWEILYDRVPTLPQSLQKDFGMIPHLWQNIAHRVARTTK